MWRVRLLRNWNSCPMYSSTANGFRPWNPKILENNHRIFVDICESKNHIGIIWLFSGINLIKPITPLVLISSVSFQELWFFANDKLARNSFLAILKSIMSNYINLVISFDICVSFLRNRNHEKWNVFFGEFVLRIQTVIEEGFHYRSLNVRIPLNQKTKILPQETHP